MRLILVRHGEISANKTDKLVGHTNSTLTKNGLSQARLVANRLKKTRINKFIVSDLKRTKDTAKEIFRYHPKSKFVLEPRIRELNYGILEGSNWDKLKSLAQKNKIDYYYYRPKFGESIHDKDLRVKKYLKELISKEKGTVLLVTHGGVIISMLLQLLKLPNSKYLEVIPTNTAVTIIDIKKNPLTVQFKKINCTKHIK